MYLKVITETTKDDTLAWLIYSYEELFYMPISFIAFV